MKHSVKSLKPKAPAVEDWAAQVLDEYEALSGEANLILIALSEKMRPQGVPGPTVLNLWRNKALVTCPFYTLKAAMGKV